MAYAIGVPKSTSIDSFEKYWKIIIITKSRVDTTPRNAMRTNGKESNTYAMAELPIVRTQRWRPCVFCFILSINHAFDNSPSKKPTSDANTMRGIPSYYTLDFQVNINPTRYFTAFGAIENATNENYCAYGYAGSYYPSIGRVLKIGINIKL